MRTNKLKGFIAGRDAAADPRIGKYEIVREIGRGGMAVVYEAVDPDLGRHVAIKVLKEANPERLRLEASAAARLRHPNIVTVHEVGDSFIVMDLVQGRTLAEALPEMPLPERVRALETVARAVDHAHQQGVIHRDLKPGNILVETSGRLVLTDFGLAKVIGDSALTQTGGRMGTPHYMAPEQVRGRGVGPAADVWALGVLLYEAITGRRPFEGETPPAVHDRITRADPAPVRGALGAVALHALEKNPANRYRSPAALADDLARFLRGEAPRSTRLWPRLRRRLPAAALLVAAGAALAVGWRVAPRVLARGETDRLRAWHAQEAELDRSLARSPDDTAALVARADLQFERAVYGRERGRDPVPDFEGAERDLDRALALAPDHEPVRLRRARTRTNLAIERINAGTLTQEEVDRALADLDAVAHRTDGRILRDGFRLRVAFWLRGQGKNPRPLLERVLAEMPARLEHADDFLNRARVLADLGRYDEADVDFAEAARLAPKRLWLWLWWAQARYGARDLAGAERHLQAALALHDMSPSAWRMLGDVRAATGRLAEAETAYSKAIRLNPSLGPGLRERLATLKARSGTAESPVPAGGPAAE